eukprot:gene27608-36332_t
MDCHHLCCYDVNIKEKRKTFFNFLVFCFLFSVSHATVDGVLAYSSAELGVEIGSAAGFTLYIFYTLSSLCLANPVLYFANSKTGLLIGMDVVQTSFLFVELQLAVWERGYFGHHKDRIIQQMQLHTLSLVAIAITTGFKLLATFLFLISTSSQFSWRPVVFGLYSVAAFISVISFYIFADTLDSPGNLDNTLLMTDGVNNDNTNNSYDVLESTSRHMEDSSIHITSSGGISNNNNNMITSTSSPLLRHSSRCQQLSLSCSKGNRYIFLQQALVVSRGLYSSKMMRLLVPYQLCFGFSSGLVSTYINGVIVTTYIGDGYIGLLSSLVTLAAVISAGPFAYICNRFRTRGKWVVMEFGGFCFLCSGLPLLVFSDEFIARWPVIVTYFLIHGIWENTNKSVIAEYFSEPGDRQAAYAMVYFSSGLAGAMGYLLFKWMSRAALAWLNIIAASLAIVCYHWSYSLFQKQCGYKKNSSTNDEDIVTILDNSLQSSKLRSGRQ